MPAPVLKALDARGAGLALLLSAFWGANPVAIKIGLTDAPPIRLAWMRFVVGGLVVLAWAWTSGRLRAFRVERDEWRPLAIVGGLFTLQIGSMNVGTALTSASHATVLLHLYAVHTVVLAHFMIPGDRLSPRRLFGVIVAYTGILLLFRGDVGGGGASLAGDGIMLASSVLLAERTVYLARAVHRVDHVKLLLAQALVGTVVFITVSTAIESVPTHWTWRLAASIAYQGVVIAGFNFVANLWLLERYRPSVLATLFLTQPIFGVVAAAFFTGDRLTADLLLASAAVALGVGISTRR